jgi:hypothetical protein
MRFFPALILVSFGLSLTTTARADEQKNAEKQLHKVTAMASDATGRRVVSSTVADTLGVKRPDLVMERRTMNINYGDVYVAHQLMKQGMTADDLAAQLKSGKKMADIANDRHLDWKQVGADAKKLNAKIEDNLYKHFLNGKPDADRDAAENYDPTVDGVGADSDVSKDEIAEAERVYVMWRDRADKARDSKLDSSTEKSAQGARGDPVRSKAGSLNPPPTTQ